MEPGLVRLVRGELILILIVSKRLVLRATHCTVAYMCSIGVRTVVSNYGARFLIVYSTRHALGGRYCTLGQVSEASP